MFLRLRCFGLILLFVFLWGDFIKILVFIEILSLIFISIVMFMCQLDYLSLNYFFIRLVFLVCESSLGFLLFIYYISIEYEVVKKFNLIQF